MVLEEGNHVCANIPYITRPLVADWLRAQLGVREFGPLVRGAGRYVDDLNRPGQLWAAFVRSPFAHARVLSVDGPAIRDIARHAAGHGAARRLDRGRRAHPIFTDEVRYVGQPVALVLAESRAAAVDAAERVDVEWEELPPTPPEPIVRFERTAGDIEGAFAAAAHVVRARHSIPRTVAAPIEPRGIVVDGSTVWISAQDTYRTRAAFKHALGRDFDVILPEVGGAFGSKGTPGPEMVAVVAAAQRLGRPVKWIETRSENFLTSYQGRGMSRRRRARVRRRRPHARAARRTSRPISARTCSRTARCRRTPRRC